MARNIYLALGDSITAGYGTQHVSQGFVSRVADFLQTKKMTERLLVVAQNGWTSLDVLRAISVIPDGVWRDTNVITFMVGGNDLRRLLRQQLLSFGSPITRHMVDQALYEFGNHLGFAGIALAHHEVPHVVVATVYNPAPNFPLAVEAIQRLNEKIRDMATRHQFVLVDVHQCFENSQQHYIEGYRSGRYEDLDVPFRRPIHPNRIGHQKISDLIISRLSETKKRVHSQPNA